MGWLESSSESGVQGSPFQEVALAGGFSRPSHHTSPSSVRATLVKTELPLLMVAIACGLVCSLVPGATPKKPYSGLTAHRRPSSPMRIQAMSSPMDSTFQPGMVGLSIARLVLPQAEGNAAATYFTTPWGLVSLRMSMCSASQPSSRAMTEAMRRA